MPATEKMIRVLLLDRQHPSTVGQLIQSIPLVQSSIGTSLAEGLTSLANGGPFDVVMIALDLALADAAALAMLPSQQPGLPVIVIADRPREDEALELLRRGVHDYLLREDLDLDTATRALRYAINVSRLLRRVQELDRHLEVANHRLRELFLPTSERLLEGPISRRRSRVSAER